MKSIKRILISSVCIFLTVSILNLAIYKHIQAQVEIDSSTQILNMRTKTIELNDRVEVMAAASKEILEYYDQFHEYAHNNNMKFVYRYITHSSRLIFTDDIFSNHENSISNEGKNPLTIDLRKRSALTAYEIDEYIFKDTKLANLGLAFIRAEIDHDINAFFLLSLAIHESGWGNSAIAKRKNNLFGFGAFDGSAFESAIQFKNKEAGIDHVAKFIKENYLSSYGQHFSGGYTLSHVNKRYASDPEWAIKIAQIMESLDRRIIEKQNIEYSSLQYEAGVEYEDN